jgi:hypothetical protein
VPPISVPYLFGLISEALDHFKVRKILIIFDQIPSNVQSALIKIKNIVESYQSGNVPSLVSVFEIIKDDLLQNSNRTCWAWATGERATMPQGVQ